jgi:hypothetical protein
MRLSTRLVRKGALIDETRAVLSEWDFEIDTPGNLWRARSENAVEARTAGWAREVTTTLGHRLTELSPAELGTLHALAASSLRREVWAACLHWYWARVDQLYYTFVTTWLFAAYEAGVQRIGSADVVPLVQSVYSGKSGTRRLTEYGKTRASRDLLRMATQFGLLSSSHPKEFVPYQLPDEAFLFLLHAMVENEPSAARIIEALGWRIFLMSPDDVERELFRLHQFRRLHYDAAGSLRQLTLPYKTASEYLGRCDL